MRWDDLQLLKLTDELEQSGETNHLVNGLALMRRAAVGQTIQEGRDDRSFTHELRLARDAGYVEWKDQNRTIPGWSDSDARPTVWLQEVWEIHLTLAGRDRARGRMIQAPLPDPDEDDGRPITGLTLEKIAEVIGNTYSKTQLPRYLTDSGLPEQFIPPYEGEWEKSDYVYSVLEQALEGGSATRRALRYFLGAWLTGQHHAAPPRDAARLITALLAQQGWHVHEGRLVIGDRTFATPDEPPEPTGEEVFIVHGRSLHRDGVWRVVHDATGRDPIILQEQPDRGSPTIIEKLERESQRAGWAIVILVGDDEGRLKGNESLLPRARQNVIAELGYFVARLGRDHVKVLYEPGVEVPDGTPLSSPPAMRAVID